MIKVKDIHFSNIIVPASGSTYVDFSVPTLTEFSRVMISLINVRGSGTGTLGYTIHGSASSGGSVYLYSGQGVETTANFTLRVLYVRSTNYENVVD